VARTIIVVIVILILVLLAGVFVRYRSTPRNATPISLTPVEVSSVNAHIGPEDAYPNLDLTPGAIDPAVTQDNIESTICAPGYTKSVRPPQAITHRLKVQLLAAYDRTGDLRDYELDHFIPLELGGCPDCVTNLWPEPYGSSFGARQKDRVENYLHRQVCSGEITLRQAQDAVRIDWVKVYNHLESVP
jgi:hypothetical protein